MQLSPQGHEKLKDQYEGGFHSTIYYVDGVPHIGYGFNLNYHDLPNPITIEFANSYFWGLIDPIEKLINQELPIVSQCLFDSLVSLVYNVGHLPEQIKKAIIENDSEIWVIWQQTAITSGGVLSPGLINRRSSEIEHAMLCSNEEFKKTANSGLIALGLFISLILLLK